MKRSLGRAGFVWAGFVWAGFVLLLLPAAAQAQTFELSMSGRGHRRFSPALHAALEAQGFTPVEADAAVRIEGRVRGRGRRWTARVEFTFEGETGRVEGAGPSPDRMAAEMAEEIRLLVPAGVPSEPPDEPAPPPEPTTGPAHVETPPAAEAAPEARSNPSNSMLELAVDVGLLGRAQSFRDDLFEALGRYQLDAWPTLGARGRFDPLRLVSDDPWLAVGLVGSVWSALGPTSGLTTDPERDLSTTLYEWTVGLVYTMPLHEVFSLEIGVAYGEMVFSLEAPEPEGEVRNMTVSEFVPDVAYAELRPSLRAGLHLPAGFTVRAGAAWLAALSTGRLDDDDWFPRSNTMGIDMQLDVQWRFDTWVGLRVYASHARRWSALNPEPGDPRIAGGALDELTRAGAELLLWLPGAP